MIQKRTQLSVFAVAALAIVAVAAVMLLAGGNPVQATATIIAPGVEGNSMPQQQDPRHAAPEACPAEGQAAAVVDSGHYALFDVYWNDDEEGELTNTVCPPEATYTREQKTNVDGEPIPGEYTYTYTRSPSSINITADPPTIIHVPNTAMVTLNESDYPEDKYREVWHADDAENPNGDGDRMVWVLPACPPDGSSDSNLCISFSAALLNPDDWAENTKIEFIVTHVHQVDIDRQDRRYVLVYDVPDTGPVLRWYSADQDVDQVLVAPGEYDRPMWVFPSRGAYEFQVFIKGHPNTKKSDPVSTDRSVSSDFRRYILHVGAGADLGVSASVEPALATGDTTLDPGDNVTIEITASNAGPDTAPSAKVDVALPEGLTYLSHNTATGTYDSTAGAWTINQFANGASATLTITATVDADTRGKALTAKATISATETVTTNSGTYDVPVPDKTPDNNMDTGTTMVASGANVDPMFQITRSVPENSLPEATVGAPIAVREPNSGDTLAFSLAGEGSGNFTVETVDGGAQIKVAANSYLNHEDTPTYNVTLQVSDGKDSNGNADSSVDHTIAVRVAVDDVSEPVGVRLTAPSTAVAGTAVLVTSEITSSDPNIPGGVDLDYIWVRRSPGGEIDSRIEAGESSGMDISYGEAGVKEYAVFVKYLDSTAQVHKTVESAWVSITWTQPQP